MAINTFITSTAPRTEAPVFGGGIMGSMRRVMHRWSEQARIRAELNAMTARELADLGINPSDIDDVARGTFRRAQ